MTDALCPLCGRTLTNARVVPWGCLGILRAVGECPMHRTVTPTDGDARVAEAVQPAVTRG